MSCPPSTLLKKTNLFISYSRKDRARVEQLYAALDGEDAHHLFRDTDDILPTEEWKPRLEALIKASDTIIFALTPQSVTSEVCRWELEYAESLNKRIIPIVVEDVDGDVPDVVSKLNYIFLTDKEDFAKVLPKIQNAISLDIDWIREHTRLGDMALRWEAATRLGAQPLRGKELEAAESWLATQPKDAPAPTQAHHAYILNSRKAASKRQRITVMSSLAALVVVGVLAGFAWVQRGQAIDATVLAEQNAEIAKNNEEKAIDALRQSTKVANTLVFDISSKFRNSKLPLDVQKGIIEEASLLQDSLIQAFPDDSKIQMSFANSRIMMAQVVNEADGANAALGIIDQAISVYDDLSKTDEYKVQATRNTASALMLKGEFLFANKCSILKG